MDLKSKENEVMRSKMIDSKTIIETALHRAVTLPKCLLKIQVAFANFTKGQEIKG